MKQILKKAIQPPVIYYCPRYFRLFAVAWSSEVLQCPGGYMRSVTIVEHV